MTRASPAIFLWILGFVLGGCGASDGDNSTHASAMAAEDSAHSRYTREFTFLAAAEPEPLIVQFAFDSRTVGPEMVRNVRGWLAREAAWDRFIEESGETSGAGGVWRVVPAGDLRLTVGGPTDIESLRFERGDRRLRLEFDSLVTGWNQDGDTRFRLLGGRLTLGSAVLSGPVVESLRIERTLEDGWPPDQDFDSVFLASGDSIQLILSAAQSGTGAAGYAWLRRGGIEQNWSDGEIRWVTVRPYENARREIPTRWSLRIPAAGLTGELDAVGFDAILGPERGGRRAVEMRYTVSGWFDLDGRRHSVKGMIRHTQQ